MPIIYWIGIPVLLVVLVGGGYLVIHAAGG
jgi:hypothetical protein